MSAPHPQAAFVRSEIDKGGEFTLRAPVAAGRMVALLQALKGRPGPVVYISRRRELREQARRMADQQGVAILCASPSAAQALTILPAVLIVEEDMRDVPVASPAPCIVRLA